MYLGYIGWAVLLLVVVVGAIFCVLLLLLLLLLLLGDLCALPFTPINET